MNSVWNPSTYDQARRRLVPCFEAFYGAAAELVARTAPSSAPRLLDLGAGTGLLSEQVASRVTPASLTLLDGSAAMLGRAEQRLARWHPTVVVAPFSAPLPAGPFDGVISALAIHHLDDAGKRDLFGRILQVLRPGGVFVNAEQILGRTPDEEEFFETMHFDAARALGSSETEIAEAQERMRLDRCAPLAEQVRWLSEAGFAGAGVYFQWFRFAVYAGWADARTCRPA